MCQKKMFFVMSLKTSLTGDVLKKIFEFSECWQTVASVAVILSESTKFGECQSIGQVIMSVIRQFFFKLITQLLYQFV